MTKTKIMPGELFIVEYINGGIVNRWAINDSKNYLTIEEGRKAAAGYTDVLVEPEVATGKIIDSRYHIVGDTSAIKYVTDVAYGDFKFAEVALKQLKVLKETQVYSRTGVLLGTIPAGSLIGTDTGAAGNSLRHLMVANCFNDGSGWKFINQVDYSYGFVNVQQGFGLEQFDATHNLQTAKTEVVADVDWATVATVIDTDVPEQTLRGDLTALTKEQVVEQVDSFFASKDLETVELRDPVQFFANAKNEAFVERELGKIDPQKATDFAAQAAAFNA